ncbi:MAG TPA: hypothetical protein VNZ94_00390 [Xanthobacteraceae bacterium]|nr:hypothetical protein [Xanthobacteraceae bacterium]
MTIIPPSPFLSAPADVPAAAIDSPPCPSIAAADATTFDAMCSLLAEIGGEPSTAVSVFGPGNILSKMEAALASAVADLNAELRSLPAFLRNPSPAYLSCVGRKK